MEKLFSLLRELVVLVFYGSCSSLATRITVCKFWFLKVLDFMKGITFNCLQIRTTMFFSIF